MPMRHLIAATLLISAATANARDPLAGDSGAAGETLAQEEAHEAALHDQLDLDHDGYLTIQEMTLAGTKFVIPNPSPEVVAEIAQTRAVRAQFERADLNHDGRISRAEALAGADRTFAEADTDYDGLLSTTEKAAYQAKYLDVLKAEMATWPPLLCQPGAACATAHK